MSLTLDRLYADLWDAHGDAYADLDRSLHPRSGEALYEAAAPLLHTGSRVLDAGCGRGTHSLELARRFGCNVLGIDAVRGPLVGLDGGKFVQALLQAIPAGDAVFDLVWCRDMLVHVPDVEGALIECARVLRPGGTMLVWATIATELMEPAEAARLFQPLAIVARNTSIAVLRHAFAGAGLGIASEDNLASELIEFYEEREGRASRELMRIARLRRRREQFEAQWGAVRCRMTMALYHWIVYHLLGKLETMLFVLQKDPQGKP